MPFARYLSIFRLLWATALAWKSDRVPRLSAALSYYALFSLAPLLAICISMLGLAFGKDVVRDHVVGEISYLAGSDAARAVAAMIAGTDKPVVSVLVSAAGFVVLIFSAIGVFVELKDALNTIWKVQPRPDRGWWGFIADYLAPMTMILGIGFLLLVSLVVSAALAAFGRYLAAVFPLGHALVWVIDLTVSTSVITLMFAMIYRILPDAPVAWRDTWLGALIAALLFALGRYLIGFYLGKAGVTSTYGAAGSLVVILVWVYYSAQILFFGAEFTRVYAHAAGSRAVDAGGRAPPTGIPSGFDARAPSPG
jgi:membrane protein